MKDNKLIAEFIGYRVFGNKCRKPMPYRLNGVLGDDIAPMQFHSSWDWLLPVVDKIKILVMEDDSDKLYNSEEWDNITHTLVQIEIKFVYKAVVEFIKTYNDGSTRTS